MPAVDALTRAQLKTPRAAAIAGIVFSVLLISSLALLWRSVPVNPLDPSAWLLTNAYEVGFAISLMPFSGVAVLWFIGVLRDRLGDREDRFFSSVFFGSGLLFLAMLFAASAVFGAIITAHVASPSQFDGSAVFVFARSLAYNIFNVFAIKMAGVFMIMTSTLALRTRFVARRIAFVGYLLAVLLLFGSVLFDLNLVIFPLWVLLISIYIRVDNFRQAPATPPR